jgi:xylan 1,4-beta-xylosidase
MNLEAALTWAFEFEDQPYFAGFRSLASNGIDKPVLNVFRMFSKMRGRRVGVQSDSMVSLDNIVRGGVREKPDVSAIASVEKDRLCVLVWHYHDDDVPGPDAKVTLTIEGRSPTTRQMKLQHFRIDEEHSNAFAAWKKMGAPQSPTPEQYAQLERAGQLARVAADSFVPTANGRALIDFSLPRQGVSLLVFE